MQFKLTKNGTSNGTLSFFIEKFTFQCTTKGCKLPKIQPVMLPKLKAKDKPYTISDGDGLSLLVKTNATKLWEFRFTSPINLKRRKTSIGKYPDVSLKMAREKVQNYRELIANGKDPIDENSDIKQKIKIDQQGVFDKVVDEWLVKQKNELAPSTYKRKVGQFKNDVKPFFKGRVISSIKHSEVVKLLEMKAIKAPESASRLFQYLNNLWQYSTMKGYCDFNIIANIHKKTILTPPQPKHYAKITDPIILAELVKRIYTYNGSYSTKNILKFVLHLPLRAENLVHLKWDYINYDKKLLTIPRAKMKVKNSNLSDFVMPLTPQVIEILEEQKLFSDGEFIFKTDGYADKPLNPTTPNRALERMGFNDEVQGNKIRLHGFRGTFRSLADTHQSEHNVSYEAKERALDHVPKNRVERAYTHKADYIKELETLMQWWSHFLTKLHEG